MNAVKFLKIRPGCSQCHKLANQRRPSSLQALSKAAELSLCDFTNSDKEAIEEFEDVLSAIWVIPLIFFITCKRRSFCHECQPFLEGKRLACLLGLSSTQQGGHREQTQLPQLCLASSHCFLRERRKHLMLPPVNFFHGINEKKIWNLLCLLVNITIGKIPQIYERNLQGQKDLNVFLRLFIPTQDIIIFMLSLAVHFFPFSHRDTFSGGHQSCRNHVVSLGIKFKQPGATQSFPAPAWGLQSNVAVGVTKYISFLYFQPYGNNSCAHQPQS